MNTKHLQQTAIPAKSLKLKQPARVRIRSFATRREFLTSVGQALAVGSVVGLDISRCAYGAARNGIRLGLVGCGGRGAGAAHNALTTGRDVQLVALADLWEEKCTAIINGLKGKVGSEQLQIPGNRRFVGFDAFERLLASGVDAVILATPPGFRPLHFEAAVRAGVHCFLEKSIAVDAPGIRQVRASAEAARQKGLSAVVGLQDRYDSAQQQLIAEISKGTIGRITRQEAIIRQTSLPMRGHRAAMEKKIGRRLGELEWQLRNWLAFVWLSGDYILEMLIHPLDCCLWATGRIPQSAKGLAERREHQGDDYGNVHDYLSVTYRYADGVEITAEISGLANATPQWQSRIEGEKGIAAMTGTIEDLQGRVIWKPSGPKNNRYQEEIDQWCASIRQGKGLNTVDSAADSTLVAIMGRTAAYTGREITWTEMGNSKEAFFLGNPKSLQDVPPYLPDKFGDYIAPPLGRPT